METAKVDIRKLQLLNDRINQCIDALSQVRLSVHGLTSAANPALGAGYGAGVGQIPFGQSHAGAFGNPFASQGIGGMQPAFGASPFGPYPMAPNPYLPNPYLQPLTPGLPHAAGPWAPASFGQFGQGVNPQPYAGLSPFGGDAQELTGRIAQTFPYVQFPAPPVVSLY